MWCSLNGNKEGRLCSWHAHNSILDDSIDLRHYYIVWVIWLPAKYCDDILTKKKSFFFQSLDLPIFFPVLNCIWASLFKFDRCWSLRIMKCFSSTASTWRRQLCGLTSLLLQLILQSQDMLTNVNSVSDANLFFSTPQQHCCVLFGWMLWNENNSSWHRAEHGVWEGKETSSSLAEHCWPLYY